MPRVVSADGSRAFFTVPNEITQQSGVLYLREDHRSTVQINVAERQGQSHPDEPSSQSARFWGSSADGSRAFFASNDQLTDDAPTNGADSLYMYETEAAAGHHLTLLSKGEPGAPGGSVRGMIGASEDGHYVYFLADGQYVHGQPLAGQPGFYLWHDGTVHYIGEMGDPGTDSFRDLPLEWPFPIRFAARVSPDGRHLLFTSHGTGVAGDIAPGLTGYGNGECASANGASGNSCEELYLYDAETDHLSCASCAQDGATATSDAIDNQRIHVSGSGTTWRYNRAISADGRYVFFSSADPLVPQDTNGAYDAYEYDSVTAEQHLLSSGTSKSPSYFMDASSDGQNVFFLTNQKLLGWDFDESYDLYDARVGGGFPEPTPESEICSGDGCQSQVAPPTSASPASAGFKGPGSPPPHRGCPKGKVRRHSRCVSRHRKSHRQDANHNRRAAR